MQSELQVSGPCLEQLATTAQVTDISQTESLPVDSQVPADGPTTGEEVAQAATSALHVSETPSLDEVANDTTTAALEGDYGPFWALLARAGYTIW